VRAKWDDDRLIVEISLANANVIETYQRSTSTPQLIVTTTMEMGGQVVNVRRIDDPGSAW
jgi:starvation-inducible outer membrane lipoprotein